MGFGTTNTITPSYQFNISALEPFDALKVVLEQAIYLRYLTLCSVNENTLISLKNKILSAVNSLPRIRTSITSLGSLYDLGKEIVIKMINDLNTPIHFDGFSPNDLYAIFTQPNVRKYINKEYTSTMTETFLTEFCSYFLGWYDSAEYPDAELNECAIYIPSLEVVENYDPRCNFLENREHKELVVNLLSKSVNRYYLNEGRCDHPCVHCFLKSFDLSNYTADDYLGLLASFALDHDKYVMTNYDGVPDFRVPDICFDLVTGSSYVRGHNAGDVPLRDKDNFFKSIDEMIANHRLQRFNDHELFGVLLATVGESSNLVNYFTKPVTVIASVEAYEYRNSPYINMTTDRLEAAMEAVDQDAPEDDASDEVEETEDTSTSTTNDLTSEDTLGDDTLTDDTSADEEDKKPPIDPKMMLLELANPTQPMSDFIYREMVARRISYIIKNPPENAMPNDILMLKRWRSRWLYLASVACLRDFLSRVSIRLSDI